MHSNFYSCKAFLRKSALFYIFLYLFLAHYATCQPDPIRWGKVSDEDIHLKMCSFDSTATAVILCDYGKVSFNYGATIEIERHVRIKILNRNAIDKANIVLPYYTENDLEKITNIKAQTLNLSPQGKVTIHEVESKQIFDVKENERWSQKRFSLPAVTEGSIIEYRYTTLSKNFTFLEAWLFQSDIPTLHSEFRALIGEGLDYRILYQGSRLVKDYSSKPTNRWVLQNLPALVDEPYTDNYLNYAEKVRFQLAGYYTQGSAMVGGHEYVNSMTSWEKLSQELLSDNSFTSYLNRHALAQDILKTLIGPGDNELTKLKKIYTYVQKNISWDGQHRIFTKKSLISLQESKSGNSAEINLFLTLLLKEAGIEANPALISTRNNGFPQADYPLLSQFNHIMTYVKTEGNEYFLNATDPARPYNLPSRTDLNIAAFILDKNTPHWVKMKTPADTRHIVSITANLADSNNPEYKLDVVHKGYYAVEQRKAFISQGKEKYTSRQLEGCFEDYHLKEFSTTAIEAIDEDFSAKYILTSTNHIHSSDKTMYLKPVLVNDFKETPFKNTLRRLPVEFSYPTSFNYVLNLTIPQGYQIQEMPKPILLKLPENMGEFRFNIQATGQQVQVISNVSIKAQFVPVEYYSHLQQFYDHIIAKHNEFIVLQKQ